MSIKDQIRAEIERLIRMNQTKNGFPAGTNCAIRIETCEHLISFLDSLQQEPPGEGLEEAAYKYTNSEAAKSVGRAWLQRDVRLSFIAGAEWQKAKMLEEAVEGKVFMSFAPGHNQMVMADVDLPTNTKVKVIIVKEDK